MQIAKEMINWLRFPKEIVELVLAPYLEMPKGEFPYVMQYHWRMRSVHVDWRMGVNDYLIGFTVLDNPKGTPKVETMDEAKRAEETVPFIFKAKNKNIGKRAETKAKQPKEWLKVTGVVKAGDPGACLNKETPVLVKGKGLIPISSIEIGDLVYTHSGKWQKVLKLIQTPQETRECYAFKKHREYFVSTSDHPFRVAFRKYSGKRVSNKLQDFTWMTAEEIFQYQQSHKSHIARLVFPIPRTSEGFKKGSFNLGMIVGFILGDGYLNKKDNRIELYFNSEKEGRLARFYQHLLRLEGYDSKIDRIRKDHSLQLSFVSGKIKKIIKEIINGKIFEYKKDFARGVYEGLLDADGYKNIITQKSKALSCLPEVMLHADYLFNFWRDERTNCFGFQKDSHAKISENRKYLFTFFRVRKTEKLKESFNLRIDEDESYFIPNLISHNTEHGPGVFYIFSKGKVTFGVQKPYFHEYFIKATSGEAFPTNTWTRIVVRRVGVFKLDPITKKPLKKREVMWRVLIPGNQIPYAISKRAIKRKYKPPKTNPTPFPVEWTKKNFSEQYSKWQEWIKGEKKEPEEKTCRTCYRFEKCTDPETLANPDRPGCKNWIFIDLIRSFESLPFADYKNFADCVRKNQDKDDPKAYCASIARKVGEILSFRKWLKKYYPVEFEEYKDAI